MPRIAISYTRFSSKRQALGHSEERQVESARAYAEEKGFLLKEIVDRGISSYRGKNVAEGVLGDLIRQVKAGELPKDLVLLVEDPDRISRETWAKVYPKVYQPLSEAGIEIHFLSFRGILKRNHSFTDLLNIGIKHDLGHDESEKKSLRCNKSWRKKRYNADGKKAMSSRVPAWLKAEKGKPIKVIPERAAIVRQIFDWASEGLGQYKISDKLLQAKVPAWGPVRKGNLPRWTPAYIRDILASRAVLGEYQPMSKWRTETDKEGNEVRTDLGKRQPDGPLIEDYYPQIITHDLWNKVNEARRDFVKAKFGEPVYGGRDKFSTKNLFRNLVWDSEYNVPMVYRTYSGWPCLVSTYRPKLKVHKIRYSYFEDAMLGFLRTVDWQELARERTGPETQKLVFAREKLAKELDSAIKVRSRYEALLDDPEAATDDRINDKYKASSKEVARLQESYRALEAEISSTRSGTELLAETKGIQIVRVDRESEERRLKLRLFLAQRIDRIELTFNARILIPEDQEQTIKEKYGIRSGKGQTTAKILFKGGAQKMAIFDGKKVTLLEFARLPLHGRRKRR
jgi:DNA invertase Pin-like site-specific DNA recombinase